MSNGPGGEVDRRPTEVVKGTRLGQTVTILHTPTRDGGSETSDTNVDVQTLPSQRTPT